MIEEKKQNELRRKYNPEGSDLRKAQMRMLELLEFLDKICRKHNLRYWLEGGTLLGAARHGGFIPWDDDTDVCMPREDALKLKKIMGADIHDGHIILQSADTDKNYLNSSWFTLRDLNSEYVQNSPYNKRLKYRGLQVDIFLMEENIPIVCQKIGFRIHQVLKFWPIFNIHGLGILKNTVNFSKRFLDTLVNPLLRLFRNNSDTSSYGLGCSFVMQFNNKHIYPLRTIDFEGRQLKCPCDVEAYLTTAFGDWEKIPDESQIQTHNASFIFK